MDFSTLNSLKLDFSSTNTTLPSLPSALLDAFIPGYGIFSQVVFRLLGFDIGLLVSGCLVVIGLSKGWQYLYLWAYGFFASYFMSSVHIEDEDQLFRQVVEWIAEQNMTRVSRDLMAVTKWVSAYDDSDEGSNEPPVGPDYAAEAAPIYFNWRKISIYGGSNEIQRNVIAKAILGL